MSILDEWIDKAEADYQGAVSLKRKRKVPLPDLVCYHCQQCIEKYLKAILTADGKAPPRTHDLLHLLGQLSADHPYLSFFAADLALLNAYGVDERYPGMTTTLADAQDAMDAVRRVRRQARRELGL